MTHFSDYSELRERMKLRLKKGAAFVAARYGLAVLANGVVTQLTFKVELLQEMPFVLYFAVAIVSTLYGGIGPGLLAIALSAFLVPFCFMPPYYELSFGGQPENAMQIALYVLVAGMSCAFLAGWKRRVLHLQEEEAKFRNLIETTAEGVLLIDDQERVVYVNEAGKRLLGAQASFIGEPLGSILPRESYGSAMDRLRSRTDSRREEPVQVITPRSKPSPLPLQMTLRRLSHQGHGLIAAWLHPAPAI